MWPVKPNRSRSGPVSSPARVVAPIRVNGGSSSGIAVAPGPLADDDVDPEVLHGHVQQLLGRAGDAVDLVDEQHLALAEAGQYRGQVAGALDRRAAGDPNRRAELGGDDHREAGLAQPGRPGQQDVVRRAIAAGGRSRSTSSSCSRTFGWPENSASRLGRRLASTSRSSGDRDRGDHGIGSRGIRFPGRRRRRSLAQRARPSSWMLRRSAAREVGLSRLGLLARRSRSRRPTSLPREAEPGERMPKLISPRRNGGHAADAERASIGGVVGLQIAPTRSRSSTTIRSAPLRPIPGTWVSAPMSLVAIARRSLPRRVHGEDGLGEFRANAIGRLKQLEQRPLIVIGEPVQGQ